MLWKTKKVRICRNFRNSLAAVNACRKLAVNLGDSIELRVILSLLYTVTIVLRTHEDDHLRESFISELSRFIDLQ